MNVIEKPATLIITLNSAERSVFESALCKVSGQNADALTEAERKVLAELWWEL